MKTPRRATSAGVRSNFKQTGETAMNVARPDAASIIRGLGGNERTGMCRCPVSSNHAHGDRKPSLHVSDGRKGVVLKCFVGCKFEAIRGALQAKGLWPTSKQRTTRPTTTPRHDYE